MNCEIFVQHASEFLDGQLKPEQRQLQAEHLEHCTYCQDHLEQLRSVSLLLSRLPQPQPPRALPLEVMAATEQQEHVPWIVSTMFSYKMAPFRPRPAAHAIGFVFSTVFFSFILWQFVYLPFWYRTVTTDSPVYVARGDIERLNPTPTEVYGVGPFTLPRLSNIHQLEYMTNRIRARSGVECIIFLARVSPTGKVTLVELLQPEADPTVEADLADVLRRTAFEPAKDGNRAIESQTVLVMYWVNVNG